MSAMDIFTQSRVSRRNGAHGVIGGLAQRYERYKTYRRTLEELEALTDRDLADLGVSRLQLRSIAYSAAYEG